MAFTVYDSNVSYFSFNGQILSSYIVSIDGLPGAADLIDVTTLNQTGRKWARSLQGIAFSIEVLWSDEATIGSDTLIGAQRAATTPVAFVYGPQGSTTTNIKYSGNCFVKDYKILTKIGDMIRARVDLQVDGVVTKGTF